MQELFQSKDPHNSKLDLETKTLALISLKERLPLVVVVCKEWWEIAYEKIVLGLQVLKSASVLF